MKALALLLLAFSSPVLAANFCTVDQYGNDPQCNYYNVQSCQQAAHFRNGACVTNPGPQTSAFQQGYQGAIAPAQAAQQSYDQGRRMKMERERHQAELRLLEAQRAAVEAQPYYPEPPRTDTFAHVYRQPVAQPQPQPPPQPQRVTYSCPIPSGGGAPYVTTVAAVGCVVIAVE